MERLLYPRGQGPRSTDKERSEEMKRAIPLTTSSILAAAIAAAAALATIALVLVASGNSALAASSLVNGNFETGDLTTGWTVDTTKSGGTAGAVASYDYSYQVTCIGGWGGLF